jgi:hypothetical protein
MSMLEVFKRPEFEGDSFLIRLHNFKVGSLEGLSPEEISYYHTKMRMFEQGDVVGIGLDQFAVNRPSLRSLATWRNQGVRLDSTNYAVAASLQNGMCVTDLLDRYSARLSSDPSCRRCVLRLANPGMQYLTSTVESLDVSCTLSMHFLTNRTSIAMRASDVMHELVPDLLLARDFFIHRVFPGVDRVSLELYSSSAQNICAWSDTMIKLGGLLVSTEKGGDLARSLQ